MLNLSCRNYQLIVNDLDCSDLLVSIVGNYDHYQSGKGIIPIKASLTLQKPHYGWNESLDHRTNPRWFRGKKIEFFVNNENLELVRSPVLGTLYILSSQYDGINKLTIEAGCILSLLDYRSPQGDGVCITGSTSLLVVSQQLLKKAGISNYSLSNLSGNLQFSLPKLTNESFISLWGKILYANNYLGYQDKNGVVRAKKILITTAPIVADLIVGQHDVSYSALQGNETPSEIYKVSGIKKYIINAVGTKTVTESFGNYTNPETNATFSGITQRITEEIDKVNGRSIESNKKTEILGAIASPTWLNTTQLWTTEIETRTSHYEPEVSIDKCSDTDEGKLLVITEKVRSIVAVTLEQFYLKLKELTEENGGEFIIFGISAPITARETVTTFSFTEIDTELDELEESAGNKLQLGKASKLTITKEPRGILVPEAMTEPDDETFWRFFNAHSLVTTEIIDEQWTELSPNQWLYRRITKQARYKKDPTETINYLQSLRDSEATILSYAFFWDLKITENFTSLSFTGNQPPAPERFPTLTQTIESPIVAIERTPSYTLEFDTDYFEFQSKIKEITIDPGLLNSLEQARDIARLESQLTWGKFMGNNCSTALFNSLLNVTPLDSVAWQEMSGDKHKFLIDGFSIAFESQQLAVSFDGIWGGRLEGIVANGFPVVLMDSSNNAIVVINHGFSDGDTVVFSGNGIISEGVEKDQIYYVIVINDNSFYIALTEGGEAIELITNNSDTLIPPLQVLGFPVFIDLIGSISTRGNISIYPYSFNNIFIELEGNISVNGDILITIFDFPSRLNNTILIDNNFIVMN